MGEREIILYSGKVKFLKGEESLGKEWLQLPSVTQFFVLIFLYFLQSHRIKVKKSNVKR
jgi:hypothetical protein